MEELPAPTYPWDVNEEGELACHLALYSFYSVHIVIFADVSNKEFSPKLKGNWAFFMSYIMK